ncbi:MAG: O-antigen ligase family protein [Isosphaeraceae bacterium]|nr:O-antigen ligase family protein [Isosphaeraceae bacterium]
MGFLLFILVNVVLFIRPSEIIPDLQALPLYELSIVSCLLICFPTVLEQLSGRSLAAQPISACVVGMPVAVILSHLSHFDTASAQVSGETFFKNLLYYLLLIGVLSSADRLHQFLRWLALLAMVLASVALLDYHGVVDIPGVESTAREETLSTGQTISFIQLRSSGIFDDPNDLCLILVVAIAISLYRLGDLRSGLSRFLWLAPLGLFGYALALTRSRGGLLALLACLMSLFQTRFGWRKAILAMLLVLPVMLVLFGGRQTSISTEEGTSQQRIKLWTEAILLFRWKPFFGIGEGKFVEENALVAHNSFVQAYAELGFFGGTLFLGIFYFAILSLYRLGSPQVQILDPELRRLRPYLAALVAGYATGMLTLSRADIVPTYMVPGLVVAYLRIAAVYPFSPIPRLDARLVQHLALVSIAFLAATYLFVRFSARWG